MSPGVQPVPWTVIGVPRGPCVGDSVMSANVSPCVDVGPAVEVRRADGVVDGRVVRLAVAVGVVLGVADTENDGSSVGAVATGGSWSPALPPDSDRVIAATATPSTSASTITRTTASGA